MPHATWSRPKATPRPDYHGAVTSQYPPTRPEPAQPYQGWAGPSADATPTVQFQTPTVQFQTPAVQFQTPTAQFQLYPQPSEEARPGPYGYSTGYDQPDWNHDQAQARPTAAYPPPPQYDPRTGGYGQFQRATPQFGQPVVYQTVHHGPIVTPKSVGVAYLLWFFLGFLGIHQFYLGRNGMGLAYLLLTVLLGWVGLGLVIVGVALLVDLFLIPTYTRDANHRLTGYRF